MEVMIVPHLYGVDSERLLLDQMCRELASLGCPVTIAPVTSYQQFVDALSAATVVVSMRYHGLIVAALGGTPCVSICYENKMVDASRYLAMEKLALPANDIRDGDIYDRVSAALVDRQGISSRLDSRTQALRKIAMAPILDSLSRLLRNPRFEVSHRPPDK